MLEFKRSTSLYVLEADKPVLKQISHVDNLGKDEDVYAVRMIENIAYVVTFYDIDPLYTIDLSDPTHPKLAGELIIPGYSSYIHPIDKNHLLTIGIINRNVHLQIFDISVLSKPKLMHHQFLEIKDSSALKDYHDFIYHKDSGLLIIDENYPIDINSSTYIKDKKRYVEGKFFVYHVDIETGFEYLGSINPKDSETKSSLNSKYGLSAQSLFLRRNSLLYFNSSDNYQDGAYIYTFTPDTIQINDAVHPENQIKSILNDI